jgi:hypothetical protein
MAIDKSSALQLDEKQRATFPRNPGVSHAQPRSPSQADAKEDSETQFCYIKQIIVSLMFCFVFVSFRFETNT